MNHDDMFRTGIFNDMDLHLFRCEPEIAGCETLSSPPAPTGGFSFSPAPAPKPPVDLHRRRLGRRGFFCIMSTEANDIAHARVEIWNCDHPGWNETHRFQTWEGSNSDDPVPIHVPITIIEQCMICGMGRQRMITNEQS